VLTPDVISRHCWTSNRRAVVLLPFVDPVNWTSLAVALRWLEGAQVATAASALWTNPHWEEYEGDLGLLRGRSPERRYPETGTRRDGDAFGRPVLRHRSTIWLMDFCERS
jgi:hypothetical protein